MPTLHKVTEETKEVITWAAIAVFAFVLLFMIFRIGTNIKEYFFPTPLPPPTVAFGKLPALSFPKNSTEKPLIYTINTVSGSLPLFPDRTTVYPIRKPDPNLLGLRRAQDRVLRIGFTSAGIPLSDTTYQWSQQQFPYQKLVLNVVSSSFTLSSNYLVNPDILENKNLPNQEQAPSFATSFFSKMSLFPDDIDTTKTKTTLLAIQNSKLVAATSQSTTQAVRVDFFQKDVNGLPFFYPHPKNSTIYVLLTGGEFEPQVIEAAFVHSTIGTKSATYPIKTSQLAFAELQKGNAYIASYFGTSNTVQIKNVFLAYYLGDPPAGEVEKMQNYILPIIVFEGDNGFFAYVLAITDPWLNK